jgi:hypothetical protein
MNVGAVVALGSRFLGGQQQAKLRFGTAMAGALLLGLWMSNPAMAQVPALVSSQPADGATEVPVTSAIQFTFDIAMSPNTVLGGIPDVWVGAIEWSGVDAMAFTYAWSADGRTVTATPDAELPAQTTIGWTLNPEEATLTLASTSGTPLPTAEYHGSFRTAEDDDPGGGDPNDEPPTLVSSSPSDGATGVSVSSTVVFVFDQEMQPNTFLGGFPPFAKGAIEWSGTGLDPSDFSYAWSGNGRVLTCTYARQLPSETEISWLLNPSDALIQIANLDGMALEEEVYQGSFTTGVGGVDPGDCNPTGVPEDWGGYNIFRIARYDQTSHATPVPASEMPFGFSASTVSPTGGPLITNAVLILPGGASRNLDGFPLGGLFFLNEEFATEADQTAAFPAGNYTLRFTQIGSPERVIPIHLPTGILPIPRIANYTDAQSINATASFTLRWDALTGAGAEDYLQLTILDGSDEVFIAPDYCLPRELPVTATSIDIPAGTLQPGRTYDASLSFGRLTYESTNAVPRMSGVGAVYRSTEFTVRTTGGNPTPDPARFVGYRQLPNGQPEMTFTGSIGTAYAIQRSPSVTGSSWTTIGTATPNASGQAVFVDESAGDQRPWYYRVAAGL